MRQCVRTRNFFPLFSELFPLYTVFMSPDDVRQEIELKVVELLKQKVEEGTMTEERSQQVAKLVLDVLQPGMSWEALLKAIPKLDDTASELSPVILPYLRHYEEMVRTKATRQVAEYIKVGQYDAAVQLSKQVIAQEGMVMTGRGRPAASPGNQD